MKSDFLNSIQTYCEQIEQNFNSIPEKRKDSLLKLTKYISEKLAYESIVKVIVICTHNSRRSHFGQIWLAVAADFYGISGLQTFSGGTEATTFNTNAIQALKRIGFRIDSDEDNRQNPHYNISWSENQKAYSAFSKKFEEYPNPTEGFAAVMVCSEADEGCPFIPGTDFRLSLPFKDPKAYDGTDLQSQKYDERCFQIATEFFYTLSKVKS